MEQAALGLFIFLMVFGGAGLVLFIRQYIRHCYWLSRAWDSSGRVDYQSVMMRIFNVWANIRDYGISRILSGSTIANSKMHYNNHTDGFDIASLSAIAGEVVWRNLSETFMRLHDGHGYSYFQIRLAYLAYCGLETGYRQYLDDHMDDCLSRESNTMSREDAYGLIFRGGAHSRNLTTFFRTLHENITREHNHTFPPEVQQRFNGFFLATTAISMSMGVCLDNDRCRKEFGTCSESLPFNRF